MFDASNQDVFTSIEVMHKDGKSPEEIATALQGEVVNDGVYKVSIKVGSTTFCHPDLQPKTGPI